MLFCVLMKKLKKFMKSEDKKCLCQDFILGLYFQIKKNYQPTENFIHFFSL